MLNKLSGWDDTIVALATAPGVAAIGVIRLSGNKAIDIANNLFPSKDLQKQATHTLHVGFIKAGDKALDEVVIALYRNPKSYTGEDVVEISCHGSPFIQEQVIHACIAEGARLAKPGEFSQRAFLNGKLDLAQAESVADLIASNTEASRNTALKNMRGGVSNELKQLREELIRFSALIELELDFSQEDVEFADRSAFKTLIGQLTESIAMLLQSFALGNVIKNGVNVAIVGKPNAGKSTLLNAFLQEQRAIVSDIPGTTRDTIEEVININGILFRLIDTAGIRAHTADVIEKFGIAKSLEKIEQADLVLYLFDRYETTAEELMAVASDFRRRNIRYLLVANKADVWEDKTVNAGIVDGHGIFPVSAKYQEGIDVLKAAMTSAVVKGDIKTEGAVVTNARHMDALQKMSITLSDIRNGLDNNIPGDLLALDVRQCLHYLGEITGEITNEDQLDFIFSKFCIGK